MSAESLDRASEIVGRSAAPDVSVVTERIAALDRHLTDRIGSLDRHVTAELAALRRETKEAAVSAEKAIEVAAEEAKDRLAAHNGLIEQMRAQAQMFASREALDSFKSERHAALDSFKDETEKRFQRFEMFQGRLIGGFTVVLAIGIANLVKVWT